MTKAVSVSEYPDRAGEIAFFARNTAPVGFLKADGSVVSRTAYAALFAAIGTTFNTGGEGATVFRLPDVRGEFIRAWDDLRGVDSGRAFGSYQADEFKSHFHSTAGSGGGNLAQPSGFTGASQVLNGSAPYLTGSMGGTETRPRNLAFLGCIKY